MFGYDTWDSVEPYVSATATKMISGLSWAFSTRPEPEYIFDCLNKDGWKELIHSNSTKGAQALKKAVDFCGEPGKKMVEKLTYTFDCLNPLAWEKLMDSKNIAEFTKAKDYCGEKGSEAVSQLKNEWGDFNYLQAGAVVLALGFAAYKNRDKISNAATAVSKLWENDASKSQAPHKKAA